MAREGREVSETESRARKTKIRMEVPLPPVDGGEKQGHFGGVEIGQGVGYASAFSKPEKRPGRPAAFYFGSFFAASASAAC
jgi:hypothetical protein